MTKNFKWLNKENASFQKLRAVCEFSRDNMILINLLFLNKKNAGNNTHKTGATAIESNFAI